MTRINTLTSGLLFGLVLIWPFLLNGQSTRVCDYIQPRQADSWVFGKKGAVNFDPQAVAQPTVNTLPLLFGVSSFSDENGDLMCFSNGMEVYNRSHYLMNSGSGLAGYSAASMSSIFVPNPGNHNQLFLFTIDMWYSPVFVDGVNYSVIDFSGTPAGTVTSKNNLLFKENAQKVCAIQHENGEYYWVIFHGFGENKGGNFYAYLVDTAGVNSTPVVSTVGAKHTGMFNNSGGTMQSSPDGSMIAVAIPDTSMVEIFNFNAGTGVLTLRNSSTPGDFYYPSGLAFSPDNTKLYLSNLPLEPADVRLLQFDLTASDPFNNPYTVETFPFTTASQLPNDSLIGSIQLATDGKIYVSKYIRGVNDGKQTLSVIYNPNRSGEACNYNHLNHIANQPFALIGGETLAGLPVFANNFLDIPHFHIMNKCHHDTSTFILRNNSNVDAQWNFSTVDPNGTLVITDPLQPGYIFSEPGTYAIELNESWENNNFGPYSTEVTIHPLPNVDLGHGYDTISILPNSSVQLDAGEYDYYTWYPGGSHDRYMDVNQTGWYSVLVTDTNCCSNTDSVYIQFAELLFPDAFKPLSTIGINQTFGVIGDISSLAAFRLQVFDRWGKIVFDTDDPTHRWDGSLSGSDQAPMGLYVWRSVFTTFESGLEPSRDIINRGTVMLVR